MKKILLIITVSLFLTSCWSTAPDGRKYKIRTTCITGHNISTIESYYDPALKMMMTRPATQYVCDWSVSDTVWKTK